MDSLSGPEPKLGAGARAWLVVPIRTEALAVVAGWFGRKADEHHTALRASARQ